MPDTQLSGLCVRRAVACVYHSNDEKCLYGEPTEKRAQTLTVDFYCCSCRLLPGQITASGISTVCKLRSNLDIK